MYSNTDIFQTMNVNAMVGTFDLTSQLQKGGKIVSRATSMPSAAMFAILITLVVFALIRLIVFNYLASFLRSMFPICVKMLKEVKPPRNLPNYFDAIPTHIIKEKLAISKKGQINENLREKYTASLSRRGLSINLEDVKPRDTIKASPGKKLRIDKERQTLEGCYSYDILANPNYNEAFGGAFSRKLLKNE